MNYFTALSYTISHIFLTLFIYLFIAPRWSKIIRILTGFSLFLSLHILDAFKFIFFPDSSLCYVVVTILQIIATQSTAFFTARKQNCQALFVGLSASSYVIAGAVFTSRELVRLTGILTPLSMITVL